MNWRMTIFDILAFPAHCWIWLCAKLVGGEFNWGPVLDDEEDQK